MTLYTVPSIGVAMRISHSRFRTPTQQSPLQEHMHDDRQWH